MDLFHRNGVVPVVRKAMVEYRAAAYSSDVLRVESAVVHRGTTSWTIRHTVTRVADNVLIADADVVLVSLDRTGRPTPLPEELTRLLGPRTGSGHAARPIAVDGGAVAVEVRGEGAPVLFVHGFPFDRTMWRHQLAGLAQMEDGSPSTCGAWASRVPRTGEYSMARYADDLVAVLDALGVGQAVVCGLSMGGYILFELLRRYPERVRGAVLCDTRAEADSGGGTAQPRRADGAGDGARPGSGGRAVAARAARASDAGGSTGGDEAVHGDGSALFGTRNRGSAAGDAGASGLDADACDDPRADTGHGRGRGPAVAARAGAGDGGGDSGVRAAR